MTSLLCLARAQAMLGVQYCEHHLVGNMPGQLHRAGVKIQWSKGWEKVLWELCEAIITCPTPVCSVSVCLLCLGSSCTLIFHSPVLNCMVQMELVPILASSLHGQVYISSSGHSDRLGDEPNHKDPIRTNLGARPRPNQ